ncbi:MAG TPA: hypothetical protein VFQ83_12985 [Candidatus Udaeobacter sp.]|nr:hypothetical protein [Candidatus Udaeobacter sp.]
MDRSTRSNWDRHKEMGMRLFVVLIALCALLSSCVDAKQTDPDSNVQQSENDRAVHGEVGAMYGHTVR